MELVFLGTSSMRPTKSRNQISVLLRYKDESILFDCGEGTQRQLRIADISPTKLTKILISHWHSDHVLGLPGLLITMASLEYSKTLEVFGPKGTKKYFDRLFNLFINKNKIKVIIHEINNEGKFLETKDL